MNAELPTIMFPAEPESVLPLLVDAAVKSLLVLALAGGLCLALRRASASTRYLIWLTAAAAVLIMPVLSLAVPPWRVLPDWTSLPQATRPEMSEMRAGAPKNRTRNALPPAAQNLVATEEAPIDQADVQSPTGIAAPTNEPGSDKAPSLAAAVDAAPGVTSAMQLIAGWLLAGWLAGALLMLMPLARGAWMIRRLAKGAVEVTCGPLAAATAEAAARLRAAPPRLLLGAPGTMPMVWGLWRKTLFLPREAALWEETQLRAVLLHELAHLKRRDPLTLLVGQLARAMHWFNPLAWLAVRQLRIERERACDDYVVTAGIKPSVYAAHLLALATTLRAAPGAASLALAMAAQPRIEGRIRSILEGTRSRRSPTAGVVTIAGIIAALTCVSLSMLRAAAEVAPPPAAAPEVTPRTFPAADQAAEEAEPTMPEVRNISWGKPGENGLQAGVIFEPQQAAYRPGDVVRCRFHFRNGGGRRLDISHPRLITHSYYEAIEVVDEAGKPIELEQDPFPAGPVGWIGGIVLPPGREFSVNGMPAAIGGPAREEGVETLIKAVPGQTCRVSFAVDNYGDSDLPPLKTGEIHFLVVAEEGADDDKQASEKPEGPVVLGLDLSQSMWRSRPADLPDLYEPAEDGSGRFKQRGEVFQMPLPHEEPASIWLNYPVTRDRFYVTHRSDRNKPETERVYGPFQGDPFERLKLEELMAGRLRGDDYSPDDIYRIKLMLRTGDADMARRALLLMKVTLGGDEGYRLAIHLSSIQGILAENAELLEKLELSEQAEEMGAIVSRAEARIEELTVEIPREEYARPANAAVKPPAEIPREAWGETVNGLRAAAILDSDSLRPGETAKVLLVVENVSDAEIKFSFSDLVQGANLQATGTDGEQLETDRAWYSGLAPIERSLLAPKERLVLAVPSVQIKKGEGDDSAGFGVTKIIAPPGSYVLRYEFGLGVNTSWSRREGGVMWRTSPAKGEWSGRLVTGKADINVLK